MNDDKFFEELRIYIEKAEVELDAKFGTHRDVKELRRAGRMPAVYEELVKRIYKTFEEESKDYKNIGCHLFLIAADACSSDQLQRKREGKNGLQPLDEKVIEQVLVVWRERLRREIPNSAGYFVFGHDA